MAPESLISYQVGAGGAAVTNSNGASGGTSSITVEGSVVVSAGGGAGSDASATYQGGTGGTVIAGTGFSGGSGGSAAETYGGGGGGGAGYPGGTPAAPNNAASTSADDNDGTNGATSAGAGGAAGLSGAEGLPGVDHPDGGGGGGGGGGQSSSGYGGFGGTPGGGAGASGSGASSNGRRGGHGKIRIKYWTTIPLLCPSGYIPVPENPAYATSAFCVAQYEMKNLLGTAVSQPGGAPYNNVNRASAIAACEASTGYTLINNRQWQTIARDIESVASNWENGTPGGVNRLSRGVSSGSGPFPADVSNPCFNTGDTCNATTWKPQRRTNVLSNGSVIWDFAGNVQEWVQGTTDELRVYPDIASGQKEFSTLSTRNQNIFGPALAISSTNGAGMIAGSGNATIVRGGAYDSGAAMIGVFATRVTMSGGSIATNLGFRCVYTP